MSTSGRGIMRGLRIFFGMFMILVYFGMSYLMIINFFNLVTPPYNYLRWIFAVVFGLYGIYRGYRQFKGLDYYRLTDKRDDDVETDAHRKVEELIKRVHDNETKS